MPAASSSHSAQSRSNPADVERERKLAGLLDAIDAREEGEEAKANRRTVRAKYRRQNVAVVIHHPGGSTSERRVLTRDLSAGGISFIHNGYLHIRTRCDIVLPRHVGGADPVRAEVMACSHIAGTWHTVGLKFDQKIFPKLYLDPEQTGDVNLQLSRPQDLKGRVLLLEDNELDRRLMAHHLRNTQIDLVGVATLAEAEAKLNAQESDGAFDLVISDLHLAGDDANVKGPDLVTRLKVAGAGTVAVCSAESNPQTLNPIRESEVGGMLLQKPYERDKLLACLAEWLGVCDESERIYSDYANKEDMQPLLEQAVEQMHHLGCELARLAEAEDYEACRNLCRTLVGSGGSYGYRQVSQSAADALKMLEATMSCEESVVPIQRLQDVCRRVTAAAPDGEESPAMAA